MSPSEPSQIFTEGELAYLESQRLGRLATVQPDGTLQVNPVSFRYNPRTQSIDIGGHRMETSQKFRNTADNGRVALVVDDIASFQPWRVRCIEIRGRGDALNDPADSAAPLGGPIIRVHARRIISWGIDPPQLSRGKRNVTESLPHG